MEEGKGVVDELDFWGGTFCLVVFATVETILFAWVFGMEKAWTELHVASDITIPRIYRFIIKYITPVFLLFILGSWAWEKAASVKEVSGEGSFWRGWILPREVPEENVPYIVGTRLLLAGVFLVLAVLVRAAWRRKKRNGGEAV